MGNSVRGGDPVGEARIAYVVSRFPKVSETFILNEIVELERLGLEIELFALIREREPVRHPEAEELMARAHYLPLLSPAVVFAQLAWLRRRPGRYLATWVRALRGTARSRAALVRTFWVMPQAAAFAHEMRALRIEHVHAHYATYPALAAWVVRELTGLTFSFTAHAHDLYEDRTMLADKLRAASFVVTISEYNRRLLADLYGGLADRTHVVRCGVDPTYFRPMGRPKPTRPFTVVCTASLQDYKGHAVLLEACALAARRGLTLRCLLVGDGEERGRLEEQARRLGLTGVVRFLGRRPRQAVRALLADADAFALASVTTQTGKKEGIPVALMEALASEVPVVATAISGVGELVTHGRSGLLVPERDAGALADALLRLARDPGLRARLAAAGRARVLDEYDLRRNARRLGALLTTPELRQGRRRWEAAGEPVPVP